MALEYGLDTKERVVVIYIHIRINILQEVAVSSLVYFSCTLRESRQKKKKNEFYTRLNDNGDDNRWYNIILLLLS